MRRKIKKISKYISLFFLLVGIAIWAWYILFILILHNIPYGEILLTIPIGILGTISGIISRNKKLIILNIIQTLAFPIAITLASYQEAREMLNK
ncbi:hypothetical protein GOQ27_08435 [Clostridium sp. D2Q-11]|uniref:Uncharacterized protein n=1 Tax=Anaeromonas frigoriresistens TaxID=2683708 RepID=A0A942UX92_9FIRM|nr:hypothetical protein [Anaeromonas frigoriresistens]MBS4538489.1 hypothetical protein [Anaeromonas frigoriresistens]